MPSGAGGTLTPTSGRRAKSMVRSATSAVTSGEFRPAVKRAARLKSPAAEWRKQAVSLLLWTSLFSISGVSSADVFTDTLTAMAPNSWQRINLNQVSDVWTPLAQRPTWATPESNISSWSGATWDRTRKSLLIWGGDQGWDQASEEGNEFYIFRANTGLWERGSLPSAITYTNGIKHSVDGIFNAPVSGESWDNVVYLENVDRVAVIAVSADGITFQNLNGGATGPYFWDPAKAAPNKVSGTTGSQVNPTAFPNVVGGQMWQNRDNFPADIGLGLQGVTAYLNKGGRDVVYFSGQHDFLWRYTVRDLNPGNDTWELIGRRPWSGKDGSGSGSVDPAREIFVKTLTANSFGYWDVGTLASSPENREIEIVPALPSGSPAVDFRHFGIQFDPALDAFVLWSGDAEVWLLEPPDDLDPDGDGIKSEASGWALRRLTPSGVGPAMPANYTGVFGKWVFLPEEQAYLGVIDPVAGDVFLYKPPKTGIAQDTTAPAIQSQLSGVLGSNGFYTSNVTVTWSVTDGESKISNRTGCDVVTISQDTIGQTLTCNATSEGGTSTQSVTIKRDAMAPEASAVATSLPNANGWYRSNVTVKFSGTDATSGVASCSGNVTIAAEGSDQSSTTGVCTDKAGNVSAPVKASGIRIDKTPPTVTGVRSPAANGAGWNNTAVTVLFSATDNNSGTDAASCGAPVTVSNDGFGQTATGYCEDRAGNKGSATVSGISLDTVAPHAIAIPSPAPNLNGWNNTNVTVSFSGTDSVSGSGLAGCTGAVVIDAEGTGVVSVGTCRDVAGNTSKTATASSNLDKTSPSGKITTPVDGGRYVQGASVASSFGCNDARSGIASCSATVPNGSAIDTSTTGSKSFTVTAVDLAGNASTTSHSYTVVAGPPTVQPVLTGTIGENGWYTSDVSLRWQVSSSMTSSTGCEARTITTDTTGVTYTCSAANDSGTSSESVTIRRDASEPAIEIRVPAKVKKRRKGRAAVTARYDCVDTVSGLAPALGCVGTVANGESLDTATRGTKTLTVRAKNAAGTTATKTVIYTVK